ncbi:THAP domain-containing 11, partial [Paramuricea clavata]
MEHVEELKWHRFPTKDEDRKRKWASLVAKGRCEFVPTDNSRICSNHFSDGKPTNKNPNPILYLTLDDYRHPKKLNLRESPSKKRKVSSCSPQPSCSTIDEQEECSENPIPAIDNVNIAIAMQFAQITRESDVRFFTGFESTKSFQEIFNFLVPRARLMKYWEGVKRSSGVEREEPNQQRIDTIILSNVYAEGSVLPINKPGPQRKTTLEQEFLLTVMRLRLGLLIKDLAFRFQISTTRVSQIWITWVKLLSKELRHLIIWPSK